MKALQDIIERCEDVAFLAEGGQKRVISARHPEFGPVVIKHGNYRHIGSLERISREVRLLKNIDSEYFPKHFEFLFDPIEREFLIVEERLQAQELSQMKHVFRDNELLLNLLRDLVTALDVLWSRRIVHRDLKPANILVTDHHEPRIIDLGIARFLEETSLTATIAQRGPATPIYAAPEQLLNRKSIINHRTDFFLLGLVALELLHGFHPFDPIHVGTEGSLVDNILAGRHVPPPEDADPKVQRFITGTLQVEPYRRFRTVGAVRGALGLENT